MNEWNIYLNFCVPIREVNDETFSTYLPIMLKLQKNFPEFVAGFDLVGQEDRGNLKEHSFLIINNKLLENFVGRPLIDFAEKLLKYPENINFFFHAGESNWMGTSSDENLVCC